MKSFISIDYELGMVHTENKIVDILRIITQSQPLLQGTYDFILVDSSSSNAETYLIN